MRASAVVNCHLISTSCSFRSSSHASISCCSFAMDFQRFGDASIGPGRLPGGVGFEQEASLDQFLGSRFAGGDQFPQSVTFFNGQRNRVLFHGGILVVPPPNTDPAAPGKSTVLLYEFPCMHHFHPLLSPSSFRAPCLFARNCPLRGSVGRRNFMASIAFRYEVSTG
jgi:hypothetical protein